MTTRKPDLELGLIGNCSIGALVDADATIVWACLPRFDSEPLFDALLHDHYPEQGLFAIELQDLERSEQRYLPNTAVLETRLYDSHGGCVEITDFCPRYRHFGRMFHPQTIVRRLRPLHGTPRIRVRLQPVRGWSRDLPRTTSGSNHVRYVGHEQVVRLTTNLSLTAVREQRCFVLDGPRTLVLGPDESLHGGVEEQGRQMYEETVDYWLDWVRHLNVPFEWQQEVIRAAITLKLNAFEDTGAVIAAMTTSIPEAAETERNWDYRYCWLRDAYYVVAALNRLGKTETMEHFLHYLMNIAANVDHTRLQPVYRISGAAELDERIIETLPGYRGIGPVREGNQAYQQVQNDSYGSVILAATQVFFDTRLQRADYDAAFALLENLGEQAWNVHDQPDAGLWEYRTSARVHTYSVLLCWAGCDRLAKIARRIGKTPQAELWDERAGRIRARIESEAWNAELGAFTENFGGRDLDASMLLLHELGFLAADDPRFVSTVAAIERELKIGEFIFRYTKRDDFGEPETAFLVCTFWYINALAALGRQAEARELFEKLLGCRNRLGLLSEDIDPRTGELWGNFPQTYSMVGIIGSAMRLSTSWEVAF